MEVIMMSRFLSRLRDPELVSKAMRIGAAVLTMVAQVIPIITGRKTELANNAQNNNAQPAQDLSTPFLKRVMANDSTKKGAAALVAGVVLAVVTEAIWPSNS
ncbi:hypothetical protein [Polyangium sp. 15x6]|uniref:hypothetical protein n=1 Tax=Polyangium sp. 15x6 TaxID=3042687 RepID=UPI00249AF70D|nr:hypothetical protein [Polyangium sp. 15x6]MDI3290689.1 hypothetical protein [Polyangium sp. 15x6]